MVQKGSGADCVPEGVPEAPALIRRLLFSAVSVQVRQLKLDEGLKSRNILTDDPVTVDITLASKCQGQDKNLYKSDDEFISSIINSWLLFRLDCDADANHPFCWRKGAPDPEKPFAW